MTGTVSRLTDKGFGLVSVEGLGQDLYFHSESLSGVTFDELREGDAVNFETELVPREKASRDVIRHAEQLLLYGEQKIVLPDTVEAVKLQSKVTAEFIMRLSRNPVDLYQLTSGDFEELIAELYHIDGYSIELMGPSNKADGGVDIVVMKCDIGSLQFRMAVQCKRHKHTNRVSAAPIRALAGVLDRFHAHAGALVTTSDFTDPAKKEAAAFFWKIGLVNYEKTIEMLRRAELLMKHPITFSPDPVKAPAIPEMFMNAINLQRA
jgi:cold shock CspA family protein